MAFGRDCVNIGGELRTGIFGVINDEVVFGIDPAKGEYKFKGRIEADDGYFDKGSIGWFKIVDGNLIGYDDKGIQRVTLIQSNIPTLGELYDGSVKYLPDSDFGFVSFVSVDSGDTSDATNTVFDYSNDNLDSDVDYYNMRFWMEDSYNSAYSSPGTVTFKSPFTISEPGAVIFNFDETISNSKAIVNNRLRIYRDEGLTDLISYVTSGTETVLEPGTYYLEITLGYHSNNLPPEGTVDLEVAVNIRNVEFRRIRTCTIIGTDGMISRWSATKYLFFKDGEGFEVRYGNNGIKINDQGVFKTSNGEHWYTI